MESVTYFMRHGGAIEVRQGRRCGLVLLAVNHVQQEQQGSSGSLGAKRNPYKMYSDTIKMIRSECASAHLC
jgi:hypothetical protein